MDFLLHLGKAQTSCNFTLVSMKVHIILFMLILSYILRLMYLGYSYLSVFKTNIYFNSHRSSTSMAHEVVLR